MQTLRQKQIDSLILEIEPFLYNATSTISTIILLFGLDNTLLRLFFGFGVIYSILLFVRSICNNFCRWHQILIINLFLICFFWTLEYISKKYFNHSFISDKNYFILFYMFLTWMALFAVSSLIYLRKRIKKTHKRCFQR